MRGVFKRERKSDSSGEKNKGESISMALYVFSYKYEREGSERGVRNVRAKREGNQGSDRMEKEAREVDRSSASCSSRRRRKPSAKVAELVRVYATRVEGDGGPGAGILREGRRRGLRGEKANKLNEIKS